MSDDFTKDTDEAWERAGADYARRLFAEWAKDHPDALAQLVGEYSDAKAADALESLRASFWSGEWERTKYGKSTLGEALP